MRSTNFSIRQDENIGVFDPPHFVNQITVEKLCDFGTYTWNFTKSDLSKHVEWV